MVLHRLIEIGEGLRTGRGRQGKKWSELAGNIIDGVGGEGAEEGDDSVCARRGWEDNVWGHFLQVKKWEGVFIRNAVQHLIMDIRNTTHIM
jgi:hypothetical protein